MKRTFRAFKNRNYALYFSGQSVSLIGTWMQRTGVAWVIYTMTHSAFMLGLTVFATQFPSFVFSLYGGIISDRYNRHKLLLITQTASMVQAIILAVIVLTKQYTVSEILVISVILGIINAFDVPIRQPLVHELVNDKDDLPNALAFNSSMVNFARLVGPALSGIILQQFGAGICFLLNAISFIAVLTSLLLMKLPLYIPHTIKKRAAVELTEGWNYLRRTPSLNIILVLVFLVSLFVLPYDTLLPIYAKVIFKGDAATFGYIRSFIGLGAIGGTLFLASLKKGANLKPILLANTVILGIGLLLFSHTSYFPLAMLFAVIAGFGTMAQNTICITIIQVNSDAKMRGRVMSYMAMVLFGMLPIGSLLLGAISEKIGAPNALLCEGICAIIIAGIFFNYLSGYKLNKKEEKEFEEAENIAIKEI